MSLARGIFSLPQSEQDAAIRCIARKAIEKAKSVNKQPRKVFLQFIRPLTHAKHAAGMPKEELAALTKHYRYLFHLEKEALATS